MLLYLKILILATLFVATGGAVFSERCRRQKLLVIMAGIVAVISSAYLMTSIYGDLRSDVAKDLSNAAVRAAEEVRSGELRIRELLDRSEAALLEEERKRAGEAARLEEERRKARNIARLEEEHRKARNIARLEEEHRKAVEAIRLEEERRKARNIARLEEERTKAVEADRLEKQRQSLESHQSARYMRDGCLYEPDGSKVPFFLPGVC